MTPEDAEVTPSAAFPTRRCEVPDCGTGASVLVLLGHQVCTAHFQAYEEWEGLLERRRRLFTSWLAKGGKP